MPVRPDHDVLRLDVAVHVARAVDRVERVAELRDDVGRMLGRERAVAAHERPQVVAGDVAHHEIGAVLGDPDAVDGHDVRVLDRPGGARLGQEPLAGLLVLDELGRDDLDGDVAVEVELAGAVHHAHAAPADDGLEAAAPEDRPRGEHVRRRRLRGGADRGAA